jgi:hypothetical protein
MWYVLIAAQFAAMARDVYRINPMPIICSATLPAATSARLDWLALFIKVVSVTTKMPGQKNKSKKIMRINHI